MSAKQKMFSIAARKRHSSAGRGSPQRSHWPFLENWRRTTLIREVNRNQVRFHLRIVSHRNAPSPSWRPIRSTSPVGPVSPAVPARSSHSSRASSTPAPAPSPGPALTSVSLHRQRPSLRIHQIQPRLSCGRDTRLKQRMGPGPQCHAYLHRRRVSSVSSILTIRSVGPVSAVSTRRGIVRIHGTHAPARAIHSVRAVQSIRAAAAGEIRDEAEVISDRNVELRAEVRMARHGDGHMRGLPITDPRIPRKRHIAFLVGSHESWRHHEIAPQYLPLALPLCHQYRAVRLCKLRHQSQLFPRRDCRTFRQAGLHRSDGSFGQVNPHPQLDLHSRSPAQREKCGHCQTGRPACVHQMGSVDFREKPIQAAWPLSIVEILLSAQLGSAVRFGQELVSRAVIQVGKLMRTHNVNRSFLYWIRPLGWLTRGNPTCLNFLVSSITPNQISAIRRSLFVTGYDSLWNIPFGLRLLLPKLNTTDERQDGMHRRQMCYVSTFAVKFRAR